MFLDCFRVAALSFQSTVQNEEKSTEVCFTQFIIIEDGSSTIVMIA